MARPFTLRIVLIAVALLGLSAPAFAQGFDRDQFTRERPQTSPTQEPEQQRAPLPPPPVVSCPPGLRMGPEGCVLDDTPPPPPTKYGALAIGSKNRIWYGVAWNRDDEEGARSAAMEGCLNQARKNRSTNCRVVHSFSDACAAMAWLNPGTGWGTAVRATKWEAESAAVAQCQKFNPRRRCVLAGSWCNGG
jgi:hypothetical protein